MRESSGGQLTTYWPMIQQRSPDFAGSFSVPENFWQKAVLILKLSVEASGYHRLKIEVLNPDQEDQMKSAPLKNGIFDQHTISSFKFLSTRNQHPFFVDL